ncbi:MAG: hypothetical protein AAF750_10855 [Planctomycetota bacterium]
MPLFSAVEWLFDAIASDDIRKYEGELNGERDDEMEQLLEQDDDLPLPTPNLPGKASDRRRLLDLDADEQTAAQRNFRSRQKRYQRKLAKPPKQKEVRAFLNTLDKTSIKLTSKSWRRFMDRLGIDLDATAGGLADD